MLILKLKKLEKLKSKKFQIFFNHFFQKYLISVNLAETFFLFCIYVVCDNI